MQKSNVKPGLSRRSMLKGGAAAATLAALGTNFAWSQVPSEVKVGVIGCGGRGSGAMGNILEAAPSTGLGVKIHAVADAFQKKAEGAAGKHKVDKKNVFFGLDAYKQLVASDVELVILATPPGFRPIHFRAAIEAGKHVFFEKPVATDPWGVREVVAAAKKATEKSLGVVAGTQRRHQPSYIETIKRIHDGAIGDLLHMSVYWNGGGIWWRKREPDMTDMEYQVHNWYHHVWLCGDQICEQHIHNLDVANWVMNDHPVSAYAMGGRQCRDKMGQPGEIWDHFCVEYEYPNGARVTSMCRHWPNSDGAGGEFVIGTKGKGQAGGGLTLHDGKKLGAAEAAPGEAVLAAAKAPAKAPAKKGGGISPYVQEHIDLLNSIKAGKPLNEGVQVAESTMVAIMGRMSAYTGKKVTWDFAMNKSQLKLIPDNVSRDAAPPPVVVPQPGETPLI